MKSAQHLIARAPSFAEQVAGRIAQRIAAGQFAPGERLVEAKLAEFYGVSRGPVREALQALSAQGLVEIRGTKGCYVRSISTEELEKMIVLRGTLDGLAARIVAATGKDEQLDRLESIAREMKSAQDAGDAPRFCALYTSFHQSLCEFAGYAMLSGWWQSMHNLACVFNSQWAFDELPDESSDPQEPVQVLRRRDPDLAERCFRSRALSEGYRRLGREVPPELKDYLID